MQDSGQANDQFSRIKDTTDTVSALRLSDDFSASFMQNLQRERHAQAIPDAFNFLVSNETDQLVRSVAGLYGIQSAKIDGGKLAFHLDVDGKKLELPLDPEKPLEAQIKALIKAKGTELEKRFGIKIVAEGAIVKNPRAEVLPDWRGEKAPAEQKARMPRLDELYAIEASMK